MQQLIHLLPFFLFLCSSPSSSSSKYKVQCFEIPLPGGRSIKYNQDTGVLRINLNENRVKQLSIQVPPSGTKPNQEIIASIQVRDTGINQKGYGAFATEEMQSGIFLGFYEGDVVKSREKLDEVVNKRMKRKNSALNSEKDNEIDDGILSSNIGSMDYVMSLDGGVTFIDGYERAKDRNSFSTVHLNHADKSTKECNCIRLFEDDRVAFFTSRDICIGEELCFDYGSNFWRGRENEKV